MKKILLFIILCILANQFVLSQSEGNVWYFGQNAGIDFNSGSPVALTNSAMSTEEGCSSISDSIGNLLFYTDGTTIYDNTHNIMLNGNALLGSFSSTQSSIITQDPGNTDRYYIFTVGETGVGGCAYSVVDMTLNGGLGGVGTTKNVILQSNVSEKITAVVHNNGYDLWIITQAFGTNDYYTYLLSSTGVNASAVVSSPGGIITQSNFSSYSIGYLKANHGGTKIAAAIRGGNLIEIYDFNNLTGALSNAITFPSTYSFAYGVEFSLNDNILYFTTQSPGQIFQINMDAGSSANIINSTTLISTFNNSWPAAIQLANNGKMYIAKDYSPYLAVINNPDVLGTGCSFVENGFYLNGMNSRLGLPNFTPSTFIHNDFTYKNLCFGDSTIFSIIDTTNIDSVYWDFGDPTTGVNNNSTLFSPYHIFSDYGNFSVKLIAYISNNTDTIIQQLTIFQSPEVFLGNDTLICLDSTITLDASAGFSYIWNNNQTTQTIDVSTQGIYSVTVSSAFGCTGIDEIYITVSPDPIPLITGQLSFCSGDFTILDVGDTYDGYLWNTNDTSHTITVNNGGTYSVTVSDISGCSAISQVNVIENTIPELFITESIPICIGDDVDLSVLVNNGLSPYNYYWSTGEIVDAIIVNPNIQTTYWVSIIDANGCNSDITYINVSPPLSIEIDLYTSDNHICPGDKISITANITNGFPPYFLYNENHDLISIPFFVNPYDTTDYIISIIDQCEIESFDTIRIFTYPIPNIGISCDSVKGCEPFVVNFNSTYQAQSYNWDFGGINNQSFDNNPTHIYNSSGSYDVKLSVVSDNGCKNSITAHNMVTVYDKPIAKFISNTERASIVKPIIFFNNLSSGHNLSYWDFGDGGDSYMENPSHNYQTLGVYNLNLIVESTFGCLDTAITEIIIEDEYTFYAPTAISPDFDNINDVFYVFGNGIDNKYFSLQIYDRWGAVIFESNDINNGWNGKTKDGDIIMIGVYTWKCIYKLPDGNYVQKAGAVSVVR